MDKTYDIAIVGAGIAGSALACALTAIDAIDGVGAANNKKSGPELKVALIEANALRTGWPSCEDSINGYDSRVSALTAGTQNFLANIGVWDDIASQRVSEFKQMRVWDAEGTGSVAFDAAAIRAPVLGHIVENRVTVAALLNCARGRSGVTVFDGQPVAGIRLAENRVTNVGSTEQPQIILQDGSLIHSHLIVAADGASSPLRAFVDMPVREWDYQHDAIVCTVRTQHPHQQTAWQRFTAHGPLAFLPLRSGYSAEAAGTVEQAKEIDTAQLHYCSVVWSQSRGQTERCMTMDDDAFARALGQAFESKLGKIEEVSKRFSFPLQQRHAVDYVKPGFALIADAAHAIHPLAGQGINLGLADVQALSGFLLAAQQRGQNMGDLSVLSRYQRERKSDNLAMMVAVEGFKRLFEPVPMPLRWLRNAGMNFVDQQQAMKNQIIRYAMGL